METIFGHFGGSTFLLFKSYYVVWKRYFKIIMHMTENKFKSYYVVWKPISNASSIWEFWRFKSYYVVWKQGMETFLHTKKSCLNRTM